MTDLSKGIIEIDGIILSKNTKPSDFSSVPSDIAKVAVSKRGHTYVNFFNPIQANGVDVFVEVNCYLDAEVPEIKLFPKVPAELKDDGYGNIAMYKLNASKKWLEGMIDCEPNTSNASCVYYKFADVDYFSSISKDIHYGLVGGEINITFHGV